MIKWIRSWFTPDPIFEGNIPTRGSKEAAGLDLVSVGNWHIPQRSTMVILTGTRCSFNKGWAAFIWDRSGLGAKGIHRFAGVIDSDYRGEWGVVIHNSTNMPLYIGSGDRVAQVVFQRVWLGRPRAGVVRNDTDRGSKGWGSTGQ